MGDEFYECSQTEEVYSTCHMIHRSSTRHFQKIPLRSLKKNTLILGSFSLIFPATRGDKAAFSLEIDRRGKAAHTEAVIAATGTARRRALQLTG
jgi:hypothetical protein